MVAVARAVVEQMAAHDRPVWQAGWLLARALRQHRLEAEPDVLHRAAHAAVERALELGRDYERDADNLAIDMAAVWDSIKITEADVVGTAARNASARPGTIHVVVPAPIQRLVDVLWKLGALSGDGVARPSQKRLAEALDRERRMVSRYFRVAQRLGIITCVDPTFTPGRKAMSWKVNLSKYTPPRDP